eukprot:scaffold134033_cov20-Tisochrysis_lutea.AAC.1
MNVGRVCAANLDVMDTLKECKPTQLVCRTLDCTENNVPYIACLQVNVGRAGAANLDVIQEVEYVKEEVKLQYLLECLQKTAPPVLVFAENKRDVDAIHEYLLVQVGGCANVGLKVKVRMWVWVWVGVYREGWSRSLCLFAGVGALVSVIMHQGLSRCVSTPLKVIRPNRDHGHVLGWPMPYVQMKCFPPRHLLAWSCLGDACLLPSFL